MTTLLRSRHALACWLLLLASLRGQPDQGTGPLDGPRDPLLRAEYLAILRDIATDSGPLDQRIQGLQTRVTKLLPRLREGEARCAADLAIRWAQLLGSSDPELALRHFDAALTIAREALDDRQIAVALAEKAKLLLRSDADAALAAYEQAAPIFEKLGDVRGWAGIVWTRGYVLHNLQRLEEAVAAYEQAASGFERLGDLQRVAMIATNRGVALRLLHRYPQALAAYEQAATAFESIGDKHGLATITMNRGIVLVALSRLEEALTAFDRAATVFEGLGDAASLAMIASERGNVFRAQRRYPDALGAYDQAAKIYETLGQEADLAATAIGRATVLVNLRRSDEALAAYDRAAAVCQKLGDRLKLARVAMGRGSVFASACRFEDALAAYGEAASGFAALGDQGRVGVANTSLHRASVYGSLGRYEEALTEYELAGGIFAAINDQGSLAGIALNRGNALESLARFEDALAAYQQATGIAESLRDHGMLASIAMNRGSVLASMRRYQEALAAYDQAAKVFEEAGDRESLAKIAANRGTALTRLGSHQEGLAAFDRALTTLRELGNQEMVASVTLSRGHALKALDRPEEALGAYAQAADILEKFGDNENLPRIAASRGDVLRSQGHHAEALRQYVDCAARIQIALAGQIQRLGQESSEAWRASYRSVVADAMASCRALLGVDREALPRAYQVLQTFHGLGTAEMLAERSALGLASIPEELRKQHATANARLLQAIARRDALRADQRRTPADSEADADDVRARERDLTEIVERARLRSRAYVDVSYPKAATLAEVQAQLPPGTALVEYVFGDADAWALVTTNGHAALVELGSSQEATAAADRLAAVLGRREFSASARELRALGKRVLDPVLSALPGEGVRALLFAPHGALCKIPFEALLVRDAEPSAPHSTWPYLVSTHDVGYVHSGTVLVAMRLDARDRKPPDGLEFLGVGHPYDAEAEGRKDDAPGVTLAVLDAERGSRQPLPGSAREVLAVAKLFAAGEEEIALLARAATAFNADPLSREVTAIDGKRFRALLRERADERTLKLDPEVRTARILHLACHGEADLTSPQLSRLVLARAASIQKATDTDGYVYARDLRDLGLSCELLVLSACESTPGKLSIVEGMTGLARAGLAGGARSVLSTLWRVGDDSARALMLSFYERLRAPGTTRLRALTEAKRAAIRSGMPLRAWCAYILWDVDTEA